MGLFPVRLNGWRITSSPDSNAEALQVARQPGAVQLWRVRRATATGSNDAVRVTDDMSMIL